MEPVSSRKTARPKGDNMLITGHDAQTPNLPTALPSTPDERRPDSVVLIHSAWAGWYYEPCTHPEKSSES